MSLRALLLILNGTFIVIKLIFEDLLEFPLLIYEVDVDSLGRTFMAFLFDKVRKTFWGLECCQLRNI